MLKNPKNPFKKFVHGESFPDRIMMGDDRFVSIAIRKKNGDLEETVKKRTSVIHRHPWLNIFIIRSLIRFVEGSVNQFYAEKPGEKNIKKTAYALVFLTILMGILLYFITPSVITFYISNLFSNRYLLGLLEGGLRIVFFVVVFFGITVVERSNDTAKYHGAEHKTIQAYKHDDLLTVEKVSKYPIRDPSCGTALIILVILYSIPVFLFLGYEPFWLRIVLMLVLLPFLMGLSFETITWLGKSNSRVAKILSAPGLWLQRLNTREPDREHIEVAICALKNLLYTKKD